jgi:type II secretory pathway predicted ATPase ExeA
MDPRHFGLSRRPFCPTADTPAYYPATAHEQAGRRLLEAVHAGEAVALLTGEPGTGKTLVALRLVAALGEPATVAFLTHTGSSEAADLWRAVLFDLGQPWHGPGGLEPRLALTDFLLKQFGEGRRTVLVIDEAHHLPARLLEELRMLTNLESRQGRAIQVVLVGQPRLARRLARPKLASLSQRVAVRVHLPPLDVHEAADYLVHHLRAAGGRPDRLMTEEALELLAAGARGVPRLLGQAAERAFALAQTAGQTHVDAEAALEALTELGLADGVKAAAGEEELPALKPVA